MKIAITMSQFDSSHGLDILSLVNTGCRGTQHDSEDLASGHKSDGDKGGNKPAEKENGDSNCSNPLIGLLGDLPTVKHIMGGH